MIYQQIMKINKIPVIAAALLITSCGMDYEQYASFDVYYPNAFVTANETVLESAALRDTCLYVSDNEINIQGGFEYAADDVIGYGHCWVKGNYEPTINKDSSNCKIYENFINSGDRFKTLISDLDHETSYSIRSFVITRDGNIGYNPEITKVTTATPHDKWFDEGFMMADAQTLPKRSDGVSITAIIDGDTITYFGLGRNGSNCFKDFYCYSSQTQTYKQVHDMPVALWGAAGFYLDTEDKNQNRIRRIYVCTGCRKAEGYSRTDFLRTAYVYNMERNEWKDVIMSWDGGTSSEMQMDVFMGSGRVGAVGFSLHGYGFVGLGHVEHNGQVTYLDDFYTFEMDNDGNGNGIDYRGFFSQMYKPFPNQSRTGASVAVLDETAYITGGIGEKGKNFNEMLRCTFTPPIDGDINAYKFTWHNISSKYPMPDDFKGRGFGVSFAMANSIYYGAGEESDGTLHSDFIKYDLTTNTISKCAPFKNGNPNETNKEFSRAFVINAGSRAYVGCGFVGGNEKFVNTRWVYRP